METSLITKELTLGSIMPSPTNPRKRFNAEELNSLSGSIKEHGVMQPILVRPLESRIIQAEELEYEIVAGERRWRASKLAGLETIPAVIRNLTDLEVLQQQIIENVERSDLHPLEEANGYKVLLASKDAKKWTIDDLAAKINKSRSYIYGTLKLTELCTYAQDMFLDGKFGREIGVLLSRIPGEQLQTQACKEIITGNAGETMGFRAAKNHIHARYTLSLSAALFDTHRNDLIPTAKSCFSCPKRSGNEPELFSDIESTDVCTDPDCFSLKKKAHATELIKSGNAIHGEEVEKIFPYSRHWTSGDYALADESYSGSGLQKPYGQLLGDDLPEAHTVVFDDGEVKNVYLKSALNEKIEEKIQSGELKLSKKEAEQTKKRAEEQAEWNKKVAQAEELTKARLADYEWIHTQLQLLDDTNLMGLLRPFVTYKIRDISSNGFGIIKETWQLQSIKDKDQASTAINSISAPDLVRLIIEMHVIHDLHASANWLERQPEKLNELKANVNAIIESSTRTAFTPPIAAQAGELSADEKTLLSTPEAAPAEEKKLPPKLQEIKDRELAKRARRAESKRQKESANADA